MRAYGDRHDDFPHETTRALGREQTRRMLEVAKAGEAPSLAEMFGRLAADSAVAGPPQAAVGSEAVRSAADHGAGQTEIDAVSIS